MKFEDFKKYKQIAESASSETLSKFPEATSIRAWMDETERIDEGLWSSIWRWLKRNLSPTARQIYKLAGEFENELEAELRAEYGKIRDSKDLASKMRASYAGRLSGDIEERMTIVAGDDEVYRELARELVNERTLKAKRRVIGSYKDVLDDTSRRRLTSEWDEGIEASGRKIKKLFIGEEERLEKLNAELSRMINSNKAIFSEVVKTLSQKEYMLRAVIAYSKYFADKKGKEITAKAAFEIAKQYANVVKEVVSRLESLGSTEEVLSAVRKAINNTMTSSKPPASMDSVKNMTEDSAKEELEYKGGSGETSGEIDTEVVRDLEDDGVITRDSEKIIGKEGVKDAVEKAAEETEEEKPTAREIEDEITSTVEKYFSKNLKFITDDLNQKIKKFNGMEDVKRKELGTKYNYSLSSDDTVVPATEDEVKKLIKDFTLLVGEIVPYYEASIDKTKIARSAVSKFIFEIYAVKKDASARMSEADRKNILNDIKIKYSLS